MTGNLQNTVLRKRKNQRDRIFVELLPVAPYASQES